MKDLLEVIEEGREEFRNKFEGANMMLDRAVPSSFIDNQIKLLTTHTKAILTNQIERMKKAQVEYLTLRNYSGGIEDNHTHDTHNKALQTQIDYLEEVISKLT